MSFNLATILRESALAAPDAPVAKFMGTTTTYAELDAQSSQFAAGLAAAGLVPGDVVAVHAPERAAVPCRLLRHPQGRHDDAAAESVAEGAGDQLPPERREGPAARDVRALHRRRRQRPPKSVGVPLYVIRFGDGPLPDGAQPFDALMGEPATPTPPAEFIRRMLTIRPS